MLCVVSVVTMMVIGVDIGAHNKVNPHVCNICPNQLLNSFFQSQGGVIFSNTTHSPWLL